VLPPHTQGQLIVLYIKCQGQCVPGVGRAQPSGAPLLETVHRALEKAQGPNFCLSACKVLQMDTLPVSLSFLICKIKMIIPSSWGLDAFVRAAVKVSQPGWLQQQKLSASQPRRLKVQRSSCGQFCFLLSCEGKMGTRSLGS
jgi:hypothetical protein